MRTRKWRLCWVVLLGLALPALGSSEEVKGAKSKRSKPWVIDAHRHIGKGGWRGNFTAEEVIADMKRLGIDRTLVLSVGNVPKTLEEEVAMGESALKVFNEFLKTGIVTEELTRFRRKRFDESAVIDAMKRYPEQLIGVKFVDLWDLGETENAIRGQGFRAMKIHPYGKFLADDPIVDGAMKLAKRLNVPVMFHTSNPEGTEPWRVGKVAARFPEVPVIMYHAAMVGYLEDAIRTTQTHRNIYLELAEASVDAMKKVFEQAPPKQILFGTDDPYNDMRRVTVQMQFERVMKLTGHDANLQRLVMGENMARVLGLKRSQ